METYIRQRQLIMSPLIPSRVIGENEPVHAVFNKVIATREVNHKGQGKRKCSQAVCSPVMSEGRSTLTVLFLRDINDVREVYRVGPFGVCLIGFLFTFAGRTVCDPEAPPRGPCPSQEGLPPLC